MSWKCAVCGLVDGRGDTVVDAVCHHCGKPLCRKHQIELFDMAFSVTKVRERVWALHCAECRRSDHPLALRRKRRTVP